MTVVWNCYIAVFALIYSASRFNKKPFRSCEFETSCFQFLLGFRNQTLFPYISVLWDYKGNIMKLRCHFLTEHGEKTYFQRFHHRLCFLKLRTNQRISFHLPCKTLTPQGVALLVLALGASDAKPWPDYPTASRQPLNIFSTHLWITEARVVHLALNVWRLFASHRWTEHGVVRPWAVEVGVARPTKVWGGKAWMQGCCVGVVRPTQ